MTTTFEGLPPPVKTASKPTVTYELYVKDYARMAAWYVILAVGGIASISGTIVYEFTGLLMVFTIAGGLAIALGGLAGFAAAAHAHANYTKLLAVSTTTTYAEPPATAPTVRPFVASRNAERTVRAGKFSLPVTTWSALFATAEANGGRLTRDAAVKVLPRSMYRDWSTTVNELQRLGLIDDAGQVTADGWRFVRRDVSPFPNDHGDDRAQTSTHARRTHDEHGVTA